MEIVLITGTGLIGTSLAELLKKNGYQVRFLSTSRDEINGFPCYRWDVEARTIQKEAFSNVSHIIHLAGAGIADKRWSEARKNEIISSRVDSANLIYKTLEQLGTTISTFISASGIGYYGANISDEIHSEEELPANDYIALVCTLWEEAAEQFDELGARVVELRTGIVLSTDGGALPKLAKPIKLFAGSPVASGKQYMPWIHIQDICRMYQFALENKKVVGPINAVAPVHTTNMELTKALAKVLKKPLLFPRVPKFLLKIFFGEMAVLLYTGSRVSSDKIERMGFIFKFNSIKEALKSLYKN